jgi:hypothetical protein
MATAHNPEVARAPKAASVELVDRTDAMIRAALRDANIGEADEEFCFEAMTAIRDYAVETGAGLRTIAEQVPGISQSVLSQMFAGNYPGRYDQRCRKLAGFLAAREAARIYGREDKFIPTRLSAGVERLLERTRYNKRIQILQSPEQLGKSRTCREYVDREESRSIMVTLQDSGTSNPFSLFLRDIGQACGFSADHVKILNLRFSVRAYLDNVDLVILDEFHKIRNWPDKAVAALLDYMRTELHADGKRGVVLVATNDDVMGILSAFRKSARYNIGQLFGRMCNDVMSIDPADIPLADIRALVERYYAPGERIVAELHEVACRDGLGHYGFLLDVLDQAWSAHRLNDSKMTDSLVRDCLKASLESIRERDAA